MSIPLETIIASNPEFVTVFNEFKEEKAAAKRMNQKYAGKKCITGCASFIKDRSNFRRHLMEDHPDEYDEMLRYFVNLITLKLI